MLTAIRNWVIRTMMKAKGETGIVKTLPKKEIVDINTQITAERLMQNGIDPRSLKNADQVENAIIAIENRSNVQTGFTTKKSADVFDLEGKKINPDKGIMGGKQFDDLPPGDDDLPPPGSRGGDDDIAAPFQSREETMKNMIEDELMKSENPFSDLVKTTKKGPKTIKEREAEILASMEKSNKETVQRIKQRKMVDDAIDNMSPSLSGDTRTDAELVAEDLAERMGLVYDDLPTKQRLDLYDQAYTALSKQRFKGMKKPKDDPDEMAQGGRAGFADGTNYFTDPDNLKMSDRDLRYLKSLSPAMQKAFLKRLNIRDMTMQADGGRAGFANGSGGLLELLNMTPKERKRVGMKQLADKIGKFVDIQAEGSKSGKQQIQGAPEDITLDTESYNFIVNADIPIGEKINLLTTFQREKGRGKVEKDGQELFLGEGGSKKRGIGLDINPDAEKGFSGKIMYDPDGGNVQGGITYKFADGGRIGYKVGSIDKARRAFLKAAAGITGGIAALKTGLLNIGKGTTKQVAKEIITTPNAPGKPEWFDALVTKVVNEGTDVTKGFATKERELVHTKQINDFAEVTVYRDLDTNTTIVNYGSALRKDPTKPYERGNIQRAVNDPDQIDLVVKGAEDVEPTIIENERGFVRRRGTKSSAEFEAYESEPRVVNYDGDMEFDGTNVVNNVDDLNEDVSVLKEYATGKKLTPEEAAKAKKKREDYQKFLEDPVEQANYLENKYGPGPEPDDFASGGIARMLGE